EVTNVDCTATDSIEVMIGAGLTLNDPIATYSERADENGNATFDLTSWYDEIIPNPEDYTIVFYESLDDAENGIDPIVAPDELAYEISTDQEIWVHVIDADDCEGIGSFMLEINEVEFNEVSEYIICDNEGLGQQDFDLDSKIAEITAGITASLDVTFHGSLADANDENG